VGPTGFTRVKQPPARKKVKTLAATPHFLYPPLRENMALPCWPNTRQSLFETRQSSCRVAEHGKVHTAKNSTAKDLCHVPFCAEHGKAFAVCLSSRSTAKIQLTESRLNRRRHVRWFLPCASNQRTRQIFKYSPCAYNIGPRQNIFFAVCHTMRRARRRKSPGSPLSLLCRVPQTGEHGKDPPSLPCATNYGARQRPFGLTKWALRVHRLLPRVIFAVFMHTAKIFAVYMHTAKGTPSFF
jgi:hypothetical protein